MLYFAWRYDEAIAELRKPLVMNPDFLGARLVLWWAYAAKGANERAVADIKQEVRRPGSRSLKKLMLAYAYAAAGNREEASGILWELEPKPVPSRRVPGWRGIAFDVCLLDSLVQWRDAAVFGVRIGIRHQGVLLWRRTAAGPSRAGDGT
ncbi:MAG TPA: hypothetical protein VFM14_09400 [Gemmatimonadales bacterium]|nr:hypothetical protein [Gemmatimonadales bacterium]